MSSQHDEPLTQTYLPTADAELRAMGLIVTVLGQLDDQAAVARVIRWAASRYIPSGENAAGDV